MPSTQAGRNGLTIYEEDPAVGAVAVLPADAGLPGLAGGGARDGPAAASAAAEAEAPLQAQARPAHRLCWESSSAVSAAACPSLPSDCPVKITDLAVLGCSGRVSRARGDLPVPKSSNLKRREREWLNGACIKTAVPFREAKWPVRLRSSSVRVLCCTSQSVKGERGIDIGGSDAIIMGGRRGRIGSKNSALCLRSLPLSPSLSPSLPLPHSGETVIDHGRRGREGTE